MGRIECEIPLGAVELEVPLWTVPQEAFDFEHLKHRHRRTFWGTELLERGPDHLEVRYGSVFLGIRLPRMRARATLRPPCEIEMKLMDGWLRGSRMIIDCKPTIEGMVGKRTYVLEVPDNIAGRSVAKIARTLAPYVYKLALPFLDRIEDDDLPAFERMNERYRNDAVLSNGMLLHFAPGEAEARMHRVSLFGLTRGCADCKRYDLGFEDESGHVRCSICDYKRLHTGERHTIEKKGAELTCRCLDERP